MKIELDDDIVLEEVEAEKKSESYILDVAKSSSYQNQTEKYYDDFGKWRSKKNNPFGYAYVKDVRERTYVDGKGFVSDGPDKAERKALANCFKLLAGLMIVTQLFVLAEYFFIAKIKGLTVFSTNFFGYALVSTDVSFDVVLVLGIMTILKLAVPIAIFFAVTKMPFSVALPKAKKRDFELSVSGVAFMLMATIFGRIANTALAYFAELIGIKMYDFSFINTTDVKSMIVYAVCEYVIASILMEIFFRGVILQIFRQYGDFFALMVSCIANVLFYGDFSTAGYMALTSAVIGLFTIRCGSVYTAIAMRVSARLVTMVVSIGIAFVDNEIALLVEAIVSVVIISFALITYSRMISSKLCDFNITDSYTHLSTKSKFVVMFSTREVVVWLVLVLILMIYNVRFI